MSLVEELPEELQDQVTLKVSEDQTKKSLGLHWAPLEDKFRFKLQNTNGPSQLSKRCILSEISKLFDPLGWLAPIIIRAKMLIQELWLQNLEWDQIVPVHIQDKWLDFYNQLKEIEEISIPRWINYSKLHTLELHGFCDASEKAYGAAVYSRTIEAETGEVKIHLLMAKSKVAPTHSRTTLPRLELCAAELLAKLIKKIKTALEDEEIKCFEWTDSMITLGWIKGKPQRWKTFVANRVSRIQSMTDPGSWYHVRSEDNPADVISRGTEPLKLKNFPLWWNGPSWLTNNNNWPVQEKELDITEEIKLCHHRAIEIKKPGIIERFSSLTKMVRVLTYCRRFIQRCRKESFENELISPKELNDTLNIIIKTIQQEEYKNEIKTVRTKKCLEKNNKLASLSPFIDDQELLRVGGRLQKSMLPFNEKHPIILPPRHHVTTLIIREAHSATLHGGGQLTLAYIRRRYWIINGKKVVRTIINRCITCVRHKAQTAQQVMGNLPEPRVTPSPPFTHTGVDYAGPIQVRASKGRGYKSYKGYIAVFVCFSTKAIHLEVVSDMTSEAFLAAYKRFISRRGPCAHLYSDNGTTFIGASKVITSISEGVSNMGTQWHFIPPAAPHFGGLWEAGVKSMKHHFKRVVGNLTLTYEEMTTLIYQIEACLNSRPLCPLANDIDEIQTLTPGHFLIGRALLSPNESNTDTEETIDELSRWRKIQKIKQNFWKAWSTEYLGRLQQRYKWKLNNENLKVGEIVLIKEENINPNKWPLAKITDIHPANDGTVRVVTLQQSGGSILKRPIHKIIPLPTSPEKLEEQELRVNSTTVPYHDERGEDVQE